MNIPAININNTPSIKDGLQDGGSVITDMDILNGRGPKANNHPGNKLFRALINRHKEQYQCPPPNMQKRDIVWNIFKNILSEQQGRFLKYIPRTGSWVQLTKKESMLKISSAFRSFKHQANKKKESAASTLLALQQQAKPDAAEDTSDDRNTQDRRQSTTHPNLPLHNKAKFTRKLYFDLDIIDPYSWSELQSRVLPQKYVHRIISIYAFHRYHIHRLEAVPNRSNKSKRVYKCATCNSNGIWHIVVRKLDYGEDQWQVVNSPVKANINNGQQYALLATTHLPCNCDRSVMGNISDQLFFNIS